jgi:protoporphyrinogen oxidase
LWLEVVQNEYRMVERQTRIYYGGKLFDYPLRADDVLGKLGLLESIRCGASYLRQQLRPKRPASSFQDWTTARFGERLFRTFFKTYSEKVWGIPCDRLDADFAAQRIRKLSLFEAVRNSFSSRSSTKHATLIDRFAYPLRGTGSVYQMMAERIQAAGGAIHLKSPVREVTPLPDGGIELSIESGVHKHYDHVVSSMPLTHLVRALPEVPSAVTAATGALRFRNTLLVYLQVESTQLFSDQWLYVHAPELEVGRITNYRNWVPELYGDDPHTILSLELWCNPGDEKWQQADEVHIEKAIRDLRATGLIRQAQISASCVVRVPNCYPIYDLGYKDHTQVVIDHLLKLPQLHVIGRAGAFKYNNQDHSLLMGILAAENIALGRKNDLWNVNTDDHYQEEAIIDETGLVPRAK